MQANGRPRSYKRGLFVGASNLQIVAGAIQALEDDGLELLGIANGGQIHRRSGRSRHALRFQQTNLQPKRVQRHRKHVVEKQIGAYQCG